MSKQFVFTLVLFGILLLFYKIAMIEYQSLKTQMRMASYIQEIEKWKQEIRAYKKRITRNDTPAYQILQKKRTGTLKFPEEEVVIFADSARSEFDRMEIDTIFQVEIDLWDDQGYGGLSISQKWNKLLFDY